MMDAQLLIFLGILSIFTGSMLFFIGNFMHSNESSSESQYRHTQCQRNDKSGQAHVDSADKSSRTEMRGGGIIMLGPIPIILGTDSKSTRTVILLAIVLMLMAFFLFR